MPSNFVVINGVNHSLPVHLDVTNTDELILTEASCSTRPQACLDVSGETEVRVWRTSGRLEISGLGIVVDGQRLDEDDEWCRFCGPAMSCPHHQGSNS